MLRRFRTLAWASASSLGCGSPAFVNSWPRRAPVTCTAYANLFDTTVTACVVVDAREQRVRRPWGWWYSRMWSFCSMCSAWLQIREITSCLSRVWVGREMASLWVEWFLFRVRGGEMALRGVLLRICTAAPSSRQHQGPLTYQHVTIRIFYQFLYRIERGTAGGDLQCYIELSPDLK